MTYVKTIWENSPSLATPINAERLNNIENGIERSSTDGVRGPVFNVLDFGAKPYDYDHDSAPGINAACQAAHEALGGEVIIPVGEYFLESPVGQTDKLLSPWSHVDLHGSGWRGVEGNSPAATKLVSKGNFPPLAGAWRSSRISNMCLDADMKGSPSARLWLAQTTVEYLDCVRWAGEGMSVGGDDYNDGLGYLNTLRRLNITDTGPEWGTSIQVNYRFVDSLIEWCNFGSNGTNMTILGGGPYRISNCWFNSPQTPIHNVEIPWSCKQAIFANCVFEGAEKSSFVVKGPSWETGDFWTNIVINGCLFVETGYNSLSEQHPVILLDSRTGGAGLRLSGFSIVGNSFRTDREKGRILEAYSVDDISLAGNTWRLGHDLSLDPIYVSDCNRVEAVGNGGDNQIEIAPGA